MNDVSFLPDMSKYRVDKGSNPSFPTDEFQFCGKNDPNFSKSW